MKSYLDNEEQLNREFDDLKMDHEWHKMQKLLINNAALCIESNWDIKTLHEKLNELIAHELIQEELINKL
jgi:hypothetical protein